MLSGGKFSAPTSKASCNYLILKITDRHHAQNKLS